MTKPIKVNFQLLKDLRAQTLAGYDLCREALLANENNFAKAVEWLRIKGIAKGEVKNNTRLANEGIVEVIIHDNYALLLELNCETDFVVNTDKFQKLFQDISKLLINNHDWKNLDDALTLKIQKNTVKEHVLHVSGQLGEKILLQQAQLLTKKPEQSFGFYNHNDHRHSALLIFDHQVNHELGEDLAMQVVALKPEFISIDLIPQKFLIEEKTILQKALIKQDLADKPQKIQDMILANRLKKRLTEICLLEQNYIKDNQIKIKELIKKNNFKILSMFNLKIGV